MPNVCNCFDLSRQMKDRRAAIGHITRAPLSSKHEPSTKLQPHIMLATTQHTM